MATFEICGTCSMHCEGEVTKIRLFPSEGYLSPDKKWDIFYPVDLKDGASAVLHAALMVFVILHRHSMSKLLFLRQLLRKK